MPIEIKYRTEVINHLENYLRTCREPDAPYMIMGEREWSLQDVTEEIKARTKLGLSFYSVWETLYDSSLSKSES